MATDHGLLFTARNIGIFTILLAIIIISVKALARVFDAMTRKTTGWEMLIQRFPVKDVHKLGNKYKNQTGYFGSSEVTKCFIIELSQEGLLIAADFDRTRILIPWLDITEVAKINMLGFTLTINLTINYHQKLIFTVPKDALKVIQENVPEERFYDRLSMRQ